LRRHRVAGVAHVGDDHLGSRGKEVDKLLPIAAGCESPVDARHRYSALDRLAGFQTADHDRETFRPAKGGDAAGAFG
jgi:hypothetical protein